MSHQNPKMLGGLLSAFDKYPITPTLLQQLQHLNCKQRETFDFTSMAKLIQFIPDPWKQQVFVLLSDFPGDFAQLAEAVEWFHDQSPLNLLDRITTAMKTETLQPWFVANQLLYLKNVAIWNQYQTLIDRHPYPKEIALIIIIFVELSLKFSIQQIESLKNPREFLIVLKHLKQISDPPPKKTFSQLLQQFDIWSDNAFITKVATLYQQPKIEQLNLLKKQNKITEQVYSENYLSICMEPTRETKQASQIIPQLLNFIDSQPIAIDTEEDESVDLANKIKLASQYLDTITLKLISKPEPRRPKQISKALLTSFQILHSTYSPLVQGPLFKEVINEIWQYASSLGDHALAHNSSLALIDLAPPDFLNPTHKFSRRLSDRSHYVFCHPNHSLYLSIAEALALVWISLTRIKSNPERPEISQHAIDKAIVCNKATFVKNILCEIHQVDFAHLSSCHTIFEIVIRGLVSLHPDAIAHEAANSLCRIFLEDEEKLALELGEAKENKAVTILNKLQTSKNLDLIWRYISSRVRNQIQLPACFEAVLSKIKLNQLVNELITPLPTGISPQRLIIKIVAEFYQRKQNYDELEKRDFPDLCPETKLSVSSQQI